jgi:hypothetical protein
MKQEVSSDQNQIFGAAHTLSRYETNKEHQHTKTTRSDLAHQEKVQIPQPLRQKQIFSFPHLIIRTQSLDLNSHSLI